MSEGQDVPTHKVSIATGCYFSEKFIERTYRSIVDQHYDNLEWQVVIDGDSDSTRAILEDCRRRAPFPIHITTFPQHRGPDVSIGTAVQNCIGDFAMILDHDDELMPNAIARLLATWDSVAATTDMSDISGVWGRCVNEKDELIGNPGPALLIASPAHYFHVEKFRGESGACLFRTDILKSYYRFTPDEVGSSNGLFWNRIGKRYKAIFTNLVVRRYYTNIPAAVSKSGAIKTPGVSANQSLEYLNDNAEYFGVDTLTFLRQIAIYQRYCVHAKRGVLRPILALRDVRMRLVAACLSPVVLGVVARDRLSGRVR